MGVVNANRIPSRRVVFVIPCAAGKADEARPAAELYTSVFFRQALAAARSEVADADIYVLSAAHGLLALDDEVAPYDLKMGDAGSVDVPTLAVQALGRGLVDAEVYALLPRSYFDRLDEALRIFDTYATPVYEATGGIGDQKHVCSVLADREAA